MYKNVEVVLDPSMRNLCYKPYYNHPKGCPNYGKRSGCPPAAPLINEVLDLSQPVWAAWVKFNLAKHRERMRGKHPKWSRRQLDCCLYWQGTLMKGLRREVTYFINAQTYLDYGILEAIYYPEAMGVNVTATLEGIGVTLEWPPEKIVHKVALIGSPHGD